MFKMLIFLICQIAIGGQLNNSALVQMNTADQRQQDTHEFLSQLLDHLGTVCSVTSYSGHRYHNKSHEINRYKQQRGAMR